MSPSLTSARAANGTAFLFFLLLAAFASPVRSRIMVFDVWKSMVTARMDPIISPGAISQHSHHIIGANGFSTQYQPDKIRQSECTNIPVQADMSNYWFPQIFQLTADGKYTGMYAGTRVYYMFNEKANTQPFPYDFQMIAGDPARKAKNMSVTFDNISNYYCEGPISGRKSYKSEGFPKERCNTLIMKIFTPSCHNGQKYNPADPHAHMRFPEDAYDGKRCPKTHPTRLPTILLESFWRPGDAVKAGLKLPPTGQPQYILANGDTTGFGLHADMQSGWDVEVLRDIIDTCYSLNTTEAEKKRCTPMAATWNSKKANACRYTGRRPNESVGWNGKSQVLDKLPGCNLPWTSGPKPRCNPKVHGRIGLAVGWIRTKATELFP